MFLSNSNDKEMLLRLIDILTIHHKQLNIYKIQYNKYW